MKVQNSKDHRKGIKDSPALQSRSKSHSEFQKSKTQDIYFLTAWGTNANGQFPAGKDRSKWQTLGQGIAALSIGDKHSVIINNKNQAFGLGSNQFGQLGLGNQILIAHKPQIIYGLRQQKVSFVSCGAYHTMVITMAGQIYSFGLNMAGQLGLGHYTNSHKPCLVQIFQNQNKDKGNFFDSQIQQLSGPLDPNQIVISIKCGALHTMLLTNKNRLFGVGHGQNYALGNGQKSNLSYFKQIHLKVGQIQLLSCGLNHTGIIAGGKIYLWGTFGNKIQYRYPQAIQFDSPTIYQPAFLDLQMGDSYSLILTSGGQVFQIGQLGNQQKSMQCPKKISGLSNINMIACGNRFCFAVGDGQVYGWGLNNYGQVTGTLKGQQPKFIPSPLIIRNMFAGSQPHRIICGWKHAMMLSYKTPLPEKQQKQNYDQKLKSQHQALKVINFQLLQKLQKSKQDSKKKTSQNIRIQTDIPSQDEKIRSPSILKKNSKFQISGTQKHRTFNNNLQIDFKEIVLEKQISQGGYGIIYRGKWRQTVVAVKMFKIQNNQSAVRDFLSQCHAMQALRHPNIVMFLGACTKPPNLCIVLQYCSRGSLWSTIQNLDIDLTWQDKKRFAVDTAKGMHYLHSCHPPILHRDLKSLNLLLDQSFKVKLADFGWTKGLANYMTGKIGTYQWMAPQVIGGQQYTQKADVFSFGIILWQIAARQPPYRNISGVQVSLQVLNNDLRPSIPKRTPQCFSRLIKRCWQRDPQRRPSFKQVIRQLQYMRFKQ